MGSQLTPLKLSIWRKYLSLLGCRFDRIKGDHEIWVRDGLVRPIVFQCKAKEIEGYHIRTNLNTLGVDVKSYLSTIKTLK